MNNMILVRGNKIAFSRMGGNYGQDAFTAMDMTDMILMPYGLFIPCHDHGYQVFTMLKDTGLFKPAEIQGFTMNVGNKGILAVPDGRNKVLYYILRTTADRQLNFVPIRPGGYGFSVVSCYDESTKIMTMSVRLTETIEQAVDMYCKYTSSNRRHVEIWDTEVMYDFLSRHHKTKLMAKLKQKAKADEKDFGDSIDVPKSIELKPA